MKITNLDPHQITQYKYDDELRADRVVLVGGEKLNINADLGGLEAKVEELSNSLKILPNFVSNTSTEIKVVEVPKIQIIEKIQYKEIEVPKIIKEIEYKEVQVPVVVTDKIIVEVEKPIIVEKFKEQSFPLWLRICLAIQTLAIIAIAIKH